MKAAGPLLLLIAATAPLACDEPVGDASRIAVAGGSITEILYFLGQQDRIVATDSTSNYPPEALDYPSVGYVRNLSAEGLLSLEPTLILGEHDMGPPAILSQVAATGISVVTVPESHDTEGVLAKIRCVARILDVEAQGELAIDQKLATALEALRRVANETTWRPRVAVILGLRDGVPLGAGTNTSGHGLVEMALAENVFADFEGWKPISMEALLRADPEYIVIPQRGVDDAGGAAELLDHPGLRFTAAARNENLIVMDGMSMLGYGPRTLGAAVDLAAYLHDIDGLSPTSGLSTLR